MGVSGYHPTVSRAQARAVLPPAACRDCVRIVRYFPLLATGGDPSEIHFRHDGLIDYPPETSRWDNIKRGLYLCENCGIIFDTWEIYAALNRVGKG